jgi:hypothetical protein
MADYADSIAYSLKAAKLIRTDIVRVLVTLLEKQSFMPVISKWQV